MDYATEILAQTETRVSQPHSAFHWTKKVIDSSYNSYHLECSKKLIELFKERYHNEHLVDELETILYRRQLMISIP